MARATAWPPMAGDGPPAHRPLRTLLGGVRVRTTLAAVAVVGMALVTGAVALVATVRDRLMDDLRAVTELRAGEIAASLEAGDRPTLSVSGAEEQLVQVADAGGDVLAASDNASGFPPVARLAPGDSATVDPEIGDDELLAVAAGASTGRGEVTVIVARSVDDVAESTDLVGRLLAVGTPILLLVVGLTTWKVVGRALRPVEAIRAEVDEISSAELHRRVPDPSGRDEIARLAATMNRMLARLDTGQARQRRFVSDASHELRSPVASLRQNAEVARAHPERSSLADLSETVLAEALRLQDLIDGLLLLARSDEGGLRIRRRPLDLDDLVFDEARRLRDVTELSIVTWPRRHRPGTPTRDACSLHHRPLAGGWRWRDAPDRRRRRPGGARG